ncbi:MAG TPA: metallophosphoesterase family protein [Chloroflexota bacterium]|jgi:diadenosine tetraphosphatase ApaH/serine/threonine PP2A family protein phosphatase|nr:metallophosphoesterase family protein [Chloroflexota bacterium]
MRVAVVADIHANLTAFDAVAADWGDVDEVWCLGDVVGYGPEPNECVARLRALRHIGIPGNHDWAALGKIDLSDFNPAARAAAEWTTGQLGPEARAYLAALPEVERREPFTLVHGSVVSPIWEYLLDTGAAAASFERLETAHALIGHSHVPLMFVAEPDGRVGGQLLRPGAPFDLAGARRILNPGSVGQPRDGDPRASYGLVERDGDRITFQLRRVAYDVAATQERMRAAGLPAALISRLALGR